MSVLMNAEGVDAKKKGAMDNDLDRDNNVCPTAGGAVAQSVEHATPGEVVGSISTVATRRSLLVGSVSV